MRPGPPVPGAAVATYHAPHRPRRRRALVLIHPIRMAPPVAVAAAVAAVTMPLTAVAWVTALGTGRVPRSIDRIAAGAHAYYARVNGTLYLLAEEHPMRAVTDDDAPFPVRLRVAARRGPVARRDVLRRLVSSPAIVATDVALGAWVLAGSGLAAGAIVATGRMPASLHRMIALGTSYHARSSAYLALISDVPPRLRERDPGSDAARRPGSGGA